MKTRPTLSAAQVFGAPALLGALSLIGLVVALLGDGWWDAASWLGLAAPVAAVLWALARRRN